MNEMPEDIFEKDGFIKYLDAISALTPAAVQDLAAAVSVRKFDKGTLLLQRGQICQRLYYLEEGLVKLFSSKDEKEFIMRFFAERSLFTGLDSYIKQTDSLYSIKAIENVVAQSVSYKDMEMLCQKHHCLEAAFRRFVSRAAVNMMDRIHEMLEEDASARYNNFIKTHGPLLQRINMGNLANYIGITQVSLSRIRAKK